MEDINNFVKGTPVYLQHGLAFVGLVYLLSHVLNLYLGFFARVVRGGKNLKKVYGPWAVVTGATDGIGLAMATELAFKGCNILLISRTLSKLQEAKKDLASKYPHIEVRTLDIDFSDFNEAAHRKVATAIADLDVGVLVNNVGVSYPFTKYFHELTDEEVDAIVHLNVTSTTWMTRIVLPGMLERKRGAIVNISSAAGVSTSPLLAQYGAAKSYVAMFSRALHYELAGKGIHVQCQVPMFVATKLAKIRKSSIMVASPLGYARAAVAAIGYDVIVSPFWSHSLQIWLLTNLPEWLVAYATFNMHWGIRAKGMKKEGAGGSPREKSVSSKKQS